MPTTVALGEEMGTVWDPVSVYNGFFWSVAQDRVVGMIYDDPTWTQRYENIYEINHA